MAKLHIAKNVGPEFREVAAALNIPFQNIQDITSHPNHKKIQFSGLTEENARKLYEATQDNALNVLVNPFITATVDQKTKVKTKTLILDLQQDVNPIKFPAQLLKALGGASTKLDNAKTAIVEERTALEKFVKAVAVFDPRLKDAFTIVSSKHDDHPHLKIKQKFRHLQSLKVIESVFSDVKKEQGFTPHSTVRVPGEQRLDIITAVTEKLGELSNDLVTRRNQVKDMVALRPILKGRIGVRFNHETNAFEVTLLDKKNGAALNHPLYNLDKAFKEALARTSPNTQAVVNQESISTMRYNNDATSRVNPGLDATLPWAKKVTASPDVHEPLGQPPSPPSSQRSTRSQVSDLTARLAREAASKATKRC